MDYHLTLRREEADRWGALADEVEEAQYKLHDAQRDLRREKQRSERLQRHVTALTEENAQLKRDNAQLTAAISKLERKEMPKSPVGRKKTRSTKPGRVRRLADRPVQAVPRVSPRTAKRNRKARKEKLQAARQRQRQTTVSAL